jgi:hypothetical protein
MIARHSTCQDRGNDAVKDNSITLYTGKAENKLE